MKNLRTFLALLLAMVLCLSGAALAEKPIVYELGDTIGDFTVTTFDGKTLTLSDVLKEKDAVLINLWATFCGPCRQEFPFMEEAYRQYADRVEIIALSTDADDTDEVLAAYTKELGMTFPVGRDTVGLSEKLDVIFIPTTVLIDRYGVICFRETGSIPRASTFCRLFDTFVGEDYSASVLLDKVPKALPTVEPSSEEELTAALNVPGGALRFTNGPEIADWPMMVGETESRTVAVSTNEVAEDSIAKVCTHIDAQAGDAVAVTFKISSAAGIDLMQVIVNGEVVKSFGGEKDWMTYAYAFPAAGAYDVEVAFSNDPTYSEGLTVLWVDSVAHLSGEEAAEALAENPVYPATDALYILPLNETAREIMISDPTGMVDAYFGSSTFWLIPEETAFFELGIPEERDPEAALIVFDYDDSMYTLADCVQEGRYVVSSGVDSMEITHFCESTAYLYPSLEDADLAVTLTYFKSEENVNTLLADLTTDQSGAILGSWSYADGAAQDAGKGVDVPSEANYIIRCIDQDGNPVAGVYCQVCDETTCQLFISDAEGLCAFTLAPYAWEIHMLKVPDGYTGDTETVTLAPVTGGELTFVLTKN